MSRPLTDRERAVLDALLSVQFDGVELLRQEAATVEVVGTCRCGCPSIEFRAEPRIGLQVRVNAVVDGSDDGLFLYTVGGHLGGIEWAGVSDNVPAEFPDPVLLKIAPA